MKRKKGPEGDKPLFSFSVDDEEGIGKAKKIRFSSEILKKGFGKILGTADKMLGEGIKDYSETGVKKSGNLKVEHGFRMRFLDEAEGSTESSTPKRADGEDEFKKVKKKKQ
jgi:hypothetical protein